MSKKSPACGLNDTVKILHGILNYEAFNRLV